LDSKRESFVKKAYEHVAQMDKDFSEEIKSSVERSLIYPTGYMRKSKLPERQFTILDDKDSVSAMLRYKNGKKAILNFASFKHPGGGFLKGRTTQEESLCHASTLYNVLSRCPLYYKENKAMQQNALYEDRLVYTPDIIFPQEDGIVKCDVLTCAAPNWRYAYKEGISYEDNLKALESRIKHISNVIIDQKIDVAILGAFGCGIFKQDPYTVARLFKEYIYCPIAVYTIPNKSSVNHIAFSEVMTKELYI
jgi:uncharacterized protein (TIGR02452 family)